MNNQTDIILPPEDRTPILVQLSQNYDLLPEEAITINEDQTVYAQYINPTERYIHRVMGDSIEGAGLVVVIDSIFYELILPDNYVFEDIRPRLFDVDRTKIVGFKYTNNTFQKLTEIDETVDFSKILSEQYNFSNLILDEVNCIFVN